MRVQAAAQASSLSDELHPSMRRRLGGPAHSPPVPESSLHMESSFLLTISCPLPSPFSWLGCCVCVSLRRHVSVCVLCIPAHGHRGWEPKKPYCSRKRPAQLGGDPLGPVLISSRSEV